MTSSEFVIDPSIASRPVPLGTWANYMNPPNGVSVQTTPYGQPPTNPNTEETYPGSGYWPGQDPPGDLYDYSIEEMAPHLDN